MSKVLLITGATGKQGGATVDALIASPRAAEFKILCLTRDPSSPSAEKLINKGNTVKLLKGDLANCDKIFKDAHRQEGSSIWGVFSVQSVKSPDTERFQGKALIDAAIHSDVKMFVYTSVDRQGDSSYNNPTYVPHSASKHDIEHYLVDKSLGTPMGYCILRPTAFMEGIAPGMMGKVFAAIFRKAMRDRPLQFVSVADIGHFAALAFTNSDKYNGAAISLAGDEIAFRQLQGVFRERTGGSLPESMGIMATLTLMVVNEVSVMMKWFHDEGYRADIPRLREQHPGLMTFGDYFVQKSGFPMQK